METKEQRLKRLAEAMSRAVGKSKFIEELRRKKIALKNDGK
jgi:hypothetical protein